MRVRSVAMVMVLELPIMGAAVYFGGRGYQGSNDFELAAAASLKARISGH